jgi:hypothetical protein
MKIENFRADNNSAASVLYFDVIPLKNGPQQILISNGTFCNFAGVFNEKTEVFSFIFAPFDLSVVMSTSLTLPTFERLIPLTISFSEATSKPQPADFLVSNATITSVEEVIGHPDTFTASLVPTLPGPVMVTVVLLENKVKSLVKVDDVFNSPSAPLVFGFDLCNECALQARDSCVLNKTTLATTCTCKNGYAGDPKDACYECPGTN